MIKYIALASVVLLIGCSSTPKKPIEDDPFYAPVYPDTIPTQVAATGSIYLDSQASSLYSDIRAHRVGDIITVTLKESTQASKSANNEIKKDTDLSVEPIYAGGKNISISGVPIDLGYGDSMNTKRESDADQSNSLNGSISANVIQVLSNGNLVIRGEKWISINNGDEFIRITGMIRSEDINPDNTIDSTRVANARIQYSGTGTFADAQKVGWLSSFFMSEWWPF
ncbi:MAG: flagellar basal body L-ring protein FlgH [Shewanella psychromarinicola]|jgi:flagellar L-ring protein precursor FlgH|uniref:Flagellar L-ring protein n=1 Tax=Shewanella psychromarinicola TaxID=2487742 RepID=A0A3N4EKT6_9GAMM|nr:flagellar basal body L-ring protein FlgH [Shewanella psychromarinicola]AZG36996.1 flagellar basal body L-ring protein FlgH [Shewanella psychromarinicola]MCL1081165.1 flagellar basal body L-ring protein FlgH [Shewanella psychromarinicola]RPA34850.1 flagellar basal body L-ring protein FlgH [Shewanella psychromarinicola]